MHELLARQLDRLGIAEDEVLDKGLGALLEVVSKTYAQNDTTRYRLERSLELSAADNTAHDRRQSALADSARILLVDDTGEPEPASLTALMTGMHATGGMIVSREPAVTFAAGWDTHPAVPSAHELLLGQEPELRQGVVVGTWTSDPKEHLLLVPIMAEHTWMGTLVFARPLHADSWTDNERAVARASASMLSATWLRRAARQDLERLVESKDQFVASVSHELRTPLSIVIGFAAELHGGWHRFDVDEAREMVNLIVDHSQDVADIVEDLLVAARADFGTINLLNEPVDLRSQISAILPRHAKFDKRTQVEGRATALADRTRVRQILRNLLTNAARYGGPAVRVRIYELDETACVEVRDNGDGLTAEAVQRIFMPFETAHAHAGRPDSVGLGLWVSQVLADRMDGTLTHHRDDHETCFTLCLPIAGRMPPV